MLFRSPIMKRGKQITILLIICTLLVVPFISAGFSDWFKGVTGKATTKPVNINISVTGGSAPIITIVDNISMTDLSSSGTTEGPSATIVNINFTAYDANGFGNINDSAAIINFTNGSTVRTNSSCVNYADFSTDYVNYTCTVTMWWWDGTGSWDIQATISDLNGNTGTNTYNINGGFITTLTGGSGSDSIIGPTAGSTWNITATNAGNIKDFTNTTSVINSFSSVNNLTGSSTNSDTFVLSDQAGISGKAEGGNGSTGNTLDYSAYNSTVIIVLGDATLGTATNINGGIQYFQNTIIPKFTFPVSISNIKRN